MRIKAHIFLQWDEGKFYWHIKAANGEIVACSPYGYSSSAEAERELLYFSVARRESAVNSRRVAGDFTGPGYNIFEGADDQWYWNYTRFKDEIVAKGGEGYSSKDGCLAAVSRMKEATFVDPEA